MNQTLHIEITGLSSKIVLYLHLNVYFFTSSCIQFFQNMIHFDQQDVLGGSNENKILHMPITASNKTVICIMAPSKELDFEEFPKHFVITTGTTKMTKTSYYNIYHHYCKKKLGPLIQIIPSKRLHFRLYEIMCLLNSFVSNM